MEQGCLILSDHVGLHPEQSSLHAWFHCKFTRYGRNRRICPRLTVCARASRSEAWQATPLPTSRQQPSDQAEKPVSLRGTGRKSWSYPRKSGPRDQGCCSLCQRSSRGGDLTATIPAMWLPSVTMSGSDFGCGCGPVVPIASARQFRPCGITSTGKTLETCCDGPNSGALPLRAHYKTSRLAILTDTRRTAKPSMCGSFIGSFQVDCQYRPKTNRSH